MNLDVHLDALYSRFERDYVVRRVADRLGITKQAASLRLDRLDRGGGGINRAVLAELLTIAFENGIPFDEILLLRSGRCFDLLPRDRTDTYLNNLVRSENAQKGKFSTFVFDLFAAQRVNRRISRKWTHMRFIPGVEQSAPALLRRTRAVLHAAEKSRRSLISIGSAKSNPMTEAIMCAGLGLEPFRSPLEVEARSPFGFVFPPRFAGPLLDASGPGDVASATARVESVSGREHSALEWCGVGAFSYQPASAGDGTKKLAKGGVDYAVVWIQSTLGSKEGVGRVALAGLSGMGTYGAAALLCDLTQGPEDTAVEGGSSSPRFLDDEFELPAVEGPFVRAFLVRVEFQDKDPDTRLREPVYACVLDHWTQTQGVDGVRKDQERLAGRNEMLRLVAEMPARDPSTGIISDPERFGSVLREFNWRKIR